MVEVKNSMGNIAPNAPLSILVSSASDVDSQWRPEPTEPTALNVESQMTHDPQLATAVALGHEQDDAGKELGIALFCTILVGAITTFFFPTLSLVCHIIAIVLASILTCSCCCASNYNLKPHVKKLATATLVTMCLLIILQIIAAIIIFTSAGEEMSSTGTISDEAIYAMAESLLPISIIAWILYALALVFSCLFSFGRSCGAPPASG